MIDLRRKMVHIVSYDMVAIPAGDRHLTGLSVLGDRNLCDLDRYTGSRGGLRHEAQGDLAVFGRLFLHTYEVGVSVSIHIDIVDTGGAIVDRLLEVGRIGHLTRLNQTPYQPEIELAGIEEIALRIDTCLGRGRTLLDDLGLGMVVATGSQTDEGQSSDQNGSQRMLESHHEAFSFLCCCNGRFQTFFLPTLVSNKSQ